MSCNACCSKNRVAAVMEQVHGPVDKAQAQFALDLLKATSDIEKNCLLSPVSISIALAMTYAGAANNTKRQINQVLFSGAKNEEKIHQKFAELVKEMSEANEDYEMIAANRMYAQKGQPVLPNFVDILIKHYRNTLHSVDFKTEADSIMKEINQWVEETTKERIKDLLSPGILNSDTRLALVNAPYFQGIWKKRFEESNTKKATFYTISNKARQMDMMRVIGWFKYAEQPECQVLGMQYRGSDLTMYVFLPMKGRKLYDLETKLTGARLLQLIDQDYYSTARVEVLLPKFKLEMSFGLGDALSSLGMSDLFKRKKADLSNITGDKSLHVSAIVHKTLIEANEQGTGAAAATEVEMKTAGSESESPKPSRKFEADHPFLFTIADERNLFFLGRYTGDE